MSYAAKALYQSLQIRSHAAVHIHTELVHAVLWREGSSDVGAAAVVDVAAHKVRRRLKDCRREQYHPTMKAAVESEAATAAMAVRAVLTCLPEGIL